MSLNTGNAILSNAITVDGSYNVGIGGSPSGSYKFEINGTSRFWDGTQGLVLRAYTGGAGFGTIYSTAVTPGAGNFALAASSTATILSGVDNVSLAINSATKLYINNAGNVGIGTSSPFTLTNFTALSINGTTGGILDLKSNGTTGLLMFSNASATILSEQRNMYMSFETNATERMRITSSGNVGIGTSSPIFQCDVNSSSYKAFRVQANDDVVMTFGSTVSSSQYYSMVTTTNASGQGVNNAFFIGRSTSNPSGLLTKDFTITSDGRVFVNATATTPYFDGKFNSYGDAAIPAACFKNAGNSQFTCSMWNAASAGDNPFLFFVTESGYAVRGSIDYNRAGGVTRYNTTSDANLKNIIGDSDLQKSINILSSTKIREYSWKNDETNKPQIGVIAQELYETFKGAVSKGSDNELFGTEEYKNWSVDKTAFTFHLIAGWQMHEKMIQELNQTIQNQQQQINQLINK